MGSALTHLVLVPVLAFGFQEAVRKPVRRPMRVSELGRYEVVTLRLPQELMTQRNLPKQVDVDAQRERAPRKIDAPQPEKRPEPTASSKPVPDPAPAPPPAPEPQPAPKPAPKAFQAPPARQVEKRDPSLAAPPSLRADAAKMPELAMPTIDAKAPKTPPKAFQAPPARQVVKQDPALAAPPSLRADAAKMPELAMPALDARAPKVAPKAFQAPPVRPAEKSEVVILQPPTVKTEVAKLTDMSLPTITMVAPKPPKTTKVFDVGAMQRNRSMPKIQDPGPLPEPPSVATGDQSIRPPASMAVNPKLPTYAAPASMQTIPATGGKAVSAGGPVVESPTNLVMSSTKPVPARETVSVPAVIVPPSGTGGGGAGAGGGGAAAPGGSGSVGSAAANGTGKAGGTAGGTASASAAGPGGGRGAGAGAGTGAGTGGGAASGTGRPGSAGNTPGATGNGTAASGNGKGGGLSPVAGTGSGIGAGAPGGTAGGVGVRPPSVSPAGPVAGGGGTGKDRGAANGAGGPGFSLGDGTGSIRIVHPSTGRHDVMIVHSGVEQILPEARGLLQGDPVYTVYLNVGWNRDWVMHYCVPREPSTGPKQVGGVVSLVEVPPLRAPFPQTTIVPPQNQIPPVPPNLAGRKRPPMLFYGYLDAKGALTGMKLKGLDEGGFGAKVLKALESWDMRPATRGDAPTRVQVLLVVPMN